MASHYSSFTLFVDIVFVLSLILVTNFVCLGDARILEDDTNGRKMVKNFGDMKNLPPFPPFPGIPFPPPLVFPPLPPFPMFPPLPPFHIPTIPFLTPPSVP